MKHLVLILNF
ncbi:hypothetical protein KGM_211324A, partial [Danaus plexippus plexippus]